MTMHRGIRITSGLTWIVVLALTTLGTSLQAGEITGIVAFGDSLSDVGNVYLATGGVNPGLGLYPGGTYPGGSYDPGHYSNGPIWLEYLAIAWVLPLPHPAWRAGRITRGAAETGNGLSFAGTPNIGTQISTYLASNTLVSTQLFTIWGGANDFLNGGVTNPAVPVANLISEITTLADAGARAVHRSQSSLARGTSRDQRISNQRRPELPHHPVR